jgi:hypothetical protein
MAFVAERVSDEDAIKYNLNEVNKRLYINPSGPWAIDRERDIYFRYVSVNREDSRESKYIFYWKGFYLKIKFRSLNYSERDGVSSKALEIIHDKLSPALFYLPSELEIYRAEIIEDLKTAIVALAEFEMKEYNFLVNYTFLF